MNQFDFTHQLLKAIQQTDEWDRIWRDVPEIQVARSQLEKVMEPVESKELRDSLLEAAYALASASENTAILYGARVALSLLSAAEQVLPQAPATANPAQLQLELVATKEQLRISEAARKLALEQRDKTATSLCVKLGKACRRAEDAEDEVVRLRAQLYDYMTAED